MGGSRQHARSGAHPRRRRIQRAARLAAGAARRDEGEGARALPRRGPPLLRGAGAMKASPAAAFASARRGAVLALAVGRRAAGAPLRAGRHRRRRRKKIDGLLDAWRFGEADAALAALRKTRARRAPRSATSTATASSCAAITTAPRARSPRPRRRAQRQPDVKMLAELAKEARDAIKDHKEERSRAHRDPLPGRGRRAGPLRARHAGGGLPGAARRPRLRRRDPDPRRVLPQPVRPGRRVVAVAGGGRAHRHDRALQMGAPDGDHAARARLRLSRGSTASTTSWFTTRCRR